MAKLRSKQPSLWLPIYIKQCKAILEWGEFHKFWEQRSVVMLDFVFVASEETY